jgi:hypothetical protein
MSPRAPTMARTSAAVRDAGADLLFSASCAAVRRACALVDGGNHRGWVDANGDGCLEAPKPSLGVLQTLPNGLRPGSPPCEATSAAIVRSRLSGSKSSPNHLLTGPRTAISRR